MPITPTWREVTLWSWQILELISYEVDIHGKKKMFERARRSPWVRAMIYDEKNKKMLLSREYRLEQKKYDYRLPWGKVFDTLEEFKNFQGDMTEEVRKAVIKEAREETGIVIHDPEIFHISHCGASVEWDLYYFIATRFEDTGTHDRDDEGEADMSTAWYTLDEVRDKIFTWEMSEDRSVGVLLRWMMGL
jgi:ADP-ribose pyrophosphatase